LLGHRKKIAKFLMRTFTCRSTFLYACQIPSAAFTVTLFVACSFKNSKILAARSTIRLVGYGLGLSKLQNIAEKTKQFTRRQFLEQAND
jgi:hypothetical protein